MGKSRLNRKGFSANRLTRIVRLYTLLRSGHLGGATNFSRLLGCSRRTFFRDINLLSNCVGTVRFDDLQESYVVDTFDQASTPPLTADELTMVLFAASSSPLAATRLFGHTIHQGVAKLSANAPQKTQVQLKRFLRSVVVETDDVNVNADQHGVLREVLASIADRRQIRLHFGMDAAELSGKSTKFAPYRLVARKVGWQLLGRSSVQRLVVWLELKHIRKAELTKELYSVPRHYLLSSTNGHENGSDSRAKTTAT